MSPAKNPFRLTQWHVIVIALMLLIMLWWWFRQEIGSIDRQIEFLHSS